MSNIFEELKNAKNRPYPKGFDRAPRRTEIDVMKSLQRHNNKSLTIYGLAKKAGCNKATVKNYVDHLGNLGFLDVNLDKNSRKTYRLNVAGMDFAFARIDQFEYEHPATEKAQNRLVEKATETIGQVDAEHRIDFVAGLMGLLSPQQQVRAVKQISGKGQLDMVRLANALQQQIYDEVQPYKDKLPPSVQQHLFRNDVGVDASLSANSIFELRKTSTRQLEKLLDRQFNINR